MVHSKIFTENASNQAKETKTQQKKCNRFFDRAVDRRSRRRAVRVRRAPTSDARPTSALIDRAGRSTIAPRDLVDRRSSIAPRDLVDRRSSIAPARSSLSLLSLSLSDLGFLFSLSLPLSLRV